MNIRKKKSDNTGVKSKKSIIPGVIAVSFIVTVIVYALMINAEKTALSEYEKGQVYVASTLIPKGTQITADNAGEFVKVTEVDVKMIPDTAVSSTEDLNGLVSSYPIVDGMVLTKGMFIPKKEITKEMAEPVIASFKAEDLYQVVGGVLRAGDYIHIYTVSEDGQATLIWQNVYVEQVFDSSGASISSDDGVSSAQRINIYMDKENVETFYSQLAQGSLRVVKVCE